MDSNSDLSFSIAPKIASDLLTRYRLNARDLPWRHTSDPYAVWISEIMLQQTQVDTVIPYFQRWMERFPTITILADCSEHEVLQGWEGLGYYGRARNLLKTAKIVADRYSGSLPSNRRDLVKLPGIGPYTAGAVLSIAFGLDEIALDGNIRRVLSRLFDISIPIQSKEGLSVLNLYARQVLPHGQAGDFNQALMDLGASICSPQSPDCPHCPLAASCLSNRLGNQNQRPVLSPRPVIPHLTVTAAIIDDQNGRFLITQRPSKGLLGGMWEFPGGKVENGEELTDGLEREIREELDALIEIQKFFGIYNHAYTHFTVTLHAFICILRKGSSIVLKEARDMRWVKPDELSQFPMGKIDRRISRELESTFVTRH